MHDTLTGACSGLKSKCFQFNSPCHDGDETRQLYERIRNK